jgi:hypothetical protein
LTSTPLWLLYDFLSLKWCKRTSTSNRKKHTNYFCRRLESLWRKEQGSVPDGTDLDQNFADRTSVFELKSGCQDLILRYQRRAESTKP